MRADIRIGSHGEHEERISEGGEHLETAENI
jgi:hypothetical protein